MVTYSRDSTDMQSSSRRAQIQSEVKKLFKENKTDYEVLSHLRSNYKDADLVDMIFDSYKERLTKIHNKARKFHFLIVNKYNKQGLSFDRMVSKAKKYAKKLNLSDDEFQTFLNLAFSEKSLMPSEVEGLPRNALARTLGYDQVMQNRLNVKAEDAGVVEDIIRLQENTKTLHSQVVLQSMTYKDCDQTAVLGGNDYANYRNNWYSFVHPIIALLFLPRIKMLDEMMLIANIGLIVKRKNEGKQLLTQPDYLLYWNLITDPNESVCDNKSPMKDLYNRFFLQTKLYDCVLNFRQGKFYNDKLSDFLVAIDNCKNHIFDAPDLTYVRDEGTILRRLLSAFSIRPTLVAATRLFNVLGAFSMPGDMNSYQNQGYGGISKVYRVPIINYRLPLHLIQKVTGSAIQNFKLTDSLSQTQWYVEDNSIVPRSQHIIHSNELIFFYVGRRYQNFYISSSTMPYNVNTLPMTVAGLEKINTNPVEVDDIIKLRGEEYILRGGIIIEVSENTDPEKRFIVGSSAFIKGIVQPVNNNTIELNNKLYFYDPQSSGQYYNNTTASINPANYKPLAQLLAGKNHKDERYNRADLNLRILNQGTIFMYQKAKVDDCLTFGTTISL